MKQVFNDGCVVTAMFWTLPDLDLGLSSVAFPLQGAASMVKDLSLHSTS